MPQKPHQNENHDDEPVRFNFDALPQHVKAVEDVYPPGWPKCPGCGLPVMEGRATCGKAGCRPRGQ
jgi:hypothetical protein